MRKQGFGSMDPKRVVELAREGGKAAHAAGTARKFTREEAVEAGKKGAAVRRANLERARRASREGAE